LVELMKILPTRPHEYYDLADLFHHFTQLLKSHQRLMNSSSDSQ
jgi:hypothetical protein